MMRKVPGVLAALALTLPSLVATPAPAAERTEVVFIGREIDLAKSFVCGGKTRKAGRYGLEISWDATAARSKLTVFKGEDNLCEVRGEPLAGSELPASKVRILTKVDAGKKAIEIDAIIPTGSRGRIPNQVFYLPLADKD
jgi:hypothetical protein